MKIIDYLNAKYGGRATTMLACEAKAFGIPYPLPNGWMASQGEAEITADVARKLRTALEASTKPSAKDGLTVLTKAWIELQTTPDAKSPAFLISKSWKRARYQALRDNGWRCQACGASPSTGAVLNVDHIKPRLLFPELALHQSNLQVLCSECNEGKGNWDMSDAREAPS